MSMTWLNEVPSNADAHYTSERIVHGIREYPVQGIYFFFITSKLAWNSFFSNTFSEYLGVSNQSNIDTLLANQRYVIMHNILLYW